MALIASNFNYFSVLLALFVRETDFIFCLLGFYAIGKGCTPK